MKKIYFFFFFFFERTNVRFGVLANHQMPNTRTRTNVRFSPRGSEALGEGHLCAICTKEQMFVFGYLLITNCSPSEQNKCSPNASGRPRLERDTELCTLHKESNKCSLNASGRLRLERDMDARKLSERTEP